MPTQVHLRQPLTRYRLQKIIGTRETDLLETDPPATLEQLEAYAEGTASQLLQLQVGFRQVFVSDLGYSSAGLRDTAEFC